MHGTARLVLHRLGHEGRVDIMVKRGLLHCPLEQKGLVSK